MSDLRGRTNSLPLFDVGFNKERGVQTTTDRRTAYVWSDAVCSDSEPGCTRRCQLQTEPDISRAQRCLTWPRCVEVSSRPAPRHTYNTHWRHSRHTYSLRQQSGYIFERWMCQFLAAKIVSHQVEREGRYKSWLQTSAISTVSRCVDFSSMTLLVEQKRASFMWKHRPSPRLFCGETRPHAEGQPNTGQLHKTLYYYCWPALTDRHALTAPMT